ncbi:hypothetical protein PMI42_02544 [Bradyrhizobium sp. YR681]|uniref:hypothetical protein n=1 Tax=Bradyrhizobium sp. YR681 TaxID=1144344 RepID=UPI000270D779|nr:hypothetical protein [Bradyrhizobium sp. YR681]EJN13897.1 hypothetical protein PMI42_02544 [Bradyrhizobium sp. YR681]
MFSIRRSIRKVFRPRNWRGSWAVACAVLYLLSGALHAGQCVDVANPYGQSHFVSTAGTPGDCEGKTIAAHHCHGCFSMTLAQDIEPGTAVDLHTAPTSSRETASVGIDPDTESPPPKHLT